MINMLSIVSLTLTLTLNQMKEKNTDINTSMKCSFKLLKSTDVGVKDVKVQYIYISYSFIYSTRFYIRVNLR